MEIRLLGALEVAVEGAVGGIPGAGERAVLALLALQAGRVVSADRLVDELWGERLPANPSNALQTRVSKLRRALALLGVDEAAVVTIGPGYRLNVDPSQVDALRFKAQVAEARRCAQQGASGEAHRRYTQALSLWHGPALADFTGHGWAAAEARRLDELRLAAVEERIDLDLRAGRHLDAAAELESLVAEHPLRERLYAQLMVALYRSGRQADALAVYQRARDLLDRELGLDPSVELRGLEAAILRQDESLGAPTPGPPASRRRGNLPARVASLVGRDAEIEEVIELLDASRLVTVAGPGGAGKTTLALEAARRVEDRFDDGVWFVDLSGASDPAHVAAIVADALQLPASDASPSESGASRLARQLHADHRLLVVDNCEHLIDACAALADGVLAGCPNVRVLATSREALAVAGEVQYALAPLPLPAAVELFEQRARAVSRDFVVDETTAASVEEICARLDGMPLAVELAAARVKTLTVAEIATRLGDRFRLLTVGSRTAKARHQTLRATVDWSYQLLSEAERVVLRRLSVFRGGWTVTSAEEVCADDAIDAAEILDLLGRLVDRSLVVVEGGRFRMLETIRAYAAERLTDAGEADTVMARNAARLVRVAEGCEPRLHGDDLLGAMRRLADEHDDLRAALTWCADGGDRALGQRLAGALAWFWYLGDHEEGRRYLHGLLDATPTDPGSRGRALQALAIVGRPSATIVHPHPACAAAAQESLRLLEADGDVRRAALSRVLLAVEGVAGHDVARSLDLLDEAAAVFADEAWGRALADFVRMKILVRWGDADEGIAIGNRAAEGFRRLGDAWGVSAVRAHQGHDLRHLGRLAEAVAADDEALQIARTAGLFNTVQLVSAEAGIARLLLGDEAGAQRNLAEAVQVARRYGYRAGDGTASVGYGYLARRHDDVAEARAHFTRAVDVLRAVGYQAFLAAASSGLGYAAELAGDAGAAEQAHRDVLEVGRTVQEPWVVAAGLEGLAGVALLRDDPWHAAELLGAAGAVRDEAGRPLDPLTRRDVDRITMRARDLLGRESFEAACARGRDDAASCRLDQLARHRDSS